MVNAEVLMVSGPGVILLPYDSKRSFDRVLDHVRTRNVIISITALRGETPKISFFLLAVLGIRILQYCTRIKYIIYQY